MLPVSPAPMTEPVTDRQFADLMVAFAPYEKAPRVAVAVSGGGDSMALVLLADAWARARDGGVTALTVDHGLRAESADEAKAVGAWMAGHGIDHRILPWTGPKPETGIQEAAREARYELMGAWCREAGVLHLALGHQEEDQAETFLMRLGRGSGTDGLAAMSAVVEGRGYRLLRPLLSIARERLRATLHERGQKWIEDPSNHDAAFRRVRIRGWLAALAMAGYPAQSLARSAAAFGVRRIEEEAQVQRLLARAATILPAGYARLDVEALDGAPRPVAAAAVSRVLATVGGGAYVPPRRKVDALLVRLVGSLPDGGGRTLGRCRCVRSGDAILVCREARNVESDVGLRAGEEARWDERFRIVAGPDAEGSRLGALGADGWAEAAEAAGGTGLSPVPREARATLPAVRDAAGLLAVPAAGFARPKAGAIGAGIARIAFSPRNTLSGAGFCLAPGD